ncbi:MAG: tetratricopeptide repeat protein [Candidatus Sericytochromatia bacterium]
MISVNSGPTTVHADLARECADVANGFILAAFEDEEINKPYLEQASHYFLKAIELDQTCLEAYLGLGYLSALTGAYERAIGLLVQAREMAPGDERIAPLLREVQRLKELDLTAVLAPPLRERRAAASPAEDLAAGLLLRVNRLRREPEVEAVDEADDEEYADEDYEDDEDPSSESEDLTFRLEDI